MKQTAVEWLEQEFIKLEKTTGVFGVMYQIIEQAKAMEKEQIIEAYCQGDDNVGAKQYYNETYKEDKQ